jgi:hypothetical protein
MGGEPGFVRPAVVVTANMIPSRFASNGSCGLIDNKPETFVNSEVRVDIPELHDESAAQCYLSQTVSTARFCNRTHWQRRERHPGSNSFGHFERLKLD